LILYLDTSALVKLYVRERGSAQTRARVDEAQALATSVVAYAESRAAFARLRREHATRNARHQERIARLDRDWKHYLRVELSPTIVRNSGELADTHGLRGFDAIHLASALWLNSAYAGELRFLAYDKRLMAGALATDLKPVD